MPDKGFQERTEPATPKKREEARKKGQVAKSRELSSISVLAAGVAYLFFCGAEDFRRLGHVLKTTFAEIPAVASNNVGLMDFLNNIIIDFIVFTMPIMLVLMISAILFNALQTGFLFSVEALTPKASKIDPIAGFQRIFSKRSLVELAKSILKLLIVGWAAASTLQAAFHRLLPLVDQEASQIATVLGEEGMNILVKCCWIVLILAVLDFFYQKWEHEENLKMTKQEIRDEHKQTEGDPLVKSRIRSIQREMARRRMMEEIPKADVVITNPTHLAVALRYDPARKPAPVVVAKGAEKLAARIKEVAREHSVPLVENRPLAQNLYNLEIGQEIPSETYQAVAEILAYVYGLKGKGPREAGKG